MSKRADILARIYSREQIIKHLNGNAGGNLRCRTLIMIKHRKLKASEQSPTAFMQSNA